MENKSKIQITKNIIELFSNYHKKNLAWGSLHIVLDDYNVEDEFVIFCINQAKEQNDTEGLNLAEMLLLMSKTQRLKISKLA